MSSLATGGVVCGVNYSLTNVITRSVSYQYDPVGNRQQVQEQAGTNAVSTAYSANALNQYTGLVVSNQSSVLSYDANGNLSGVAAEAESDETPLSFAAMSPAGPWTYQYDAQNRLLSATSATLAVQFSYDARNRCVNRKFYSWTTGSWLLTSDSFLTYDGWSLIEERDASGTLLDKYIHGANIDEILVRYNSGAVYYHHDGLGSVTHLTDATGSVVESYQYDVYGAPTFWDAFGTQLPASNYQNRFLYTGREYLAELGLYDYRNRFYSSALGRFLQTDPIRFDAEDVNLYGYAGNEPISHTDPLGDRAKTFWFITFAIRFTHDSATEREAEESHERQHRHDWWDGNKDPGWKKEQRGYAAELPIWRKRIAELKSKPCLTDNEKRELAQDERELGVAENIATDDFSAKTYWNSTKVFWQKEVK